MTKDEVTRIISNAFSNTLSTSVSTIFKPNADWYFDAAKATADFLGIKWNEISIEALVRNRDRMSFMTPEAFHYYFPSFLLAVIHYPEVVDVLHENLLSKLVPPDSSATYYGEWIKRADTFTEEQIKAILDFLESYTDIFPPERRVFREEDKKRINKAIDFWQQKVK